MKRFLIALAFVWLVCDFYPPADPSQTPKSFTISVNREEWDTVAKRWIDRGGATIWVPAGIEYQYPEGTRIHEDMSKLIAGSSYTIKAKAINAAGIPSDPSLPLRIYVQQTYIPSCRAWYTLKIDDFGKLYWGDRLFDCED